jgi:hypothetical protein
MELLIVLACLWAGAQWLRSTEPEDAVASASRPADPLATGSVLTRQPGREDGKPDPSGNADLATLKSLFEAAAILGRR